MLLIGHRGSSGEAPENTLESFRLALKQGVDMIEFDIRLTRDRVPVVIHDARLLRTHGAMVKVSSLTLDELRARTTDLPVPTLREVLDICYGHVPINIEIKSAGAGPIAFKILKQHYIKRKSDWNQIMFSSFSVMELFRMRPLGSHLRLSLLHDHNAYTFVVFAPVLKLYGVGFHLAYVEQSALMIAKRMKLKKFVYTVNTVQSGQKLRERGIDGIFTNYPDLLRPVCESEKGEK